MGSGQEAVPFQGTPGLSVLTKRQTSLIPKESQTNPLYLEQFKIKKGSPVHRQTGDAWRICWWWSTTKFFGWLLGWEMRKKF
jgi:hypothetical protein